MPKKIFFSDMVDGAGAGLRKAFSAAVAKPLVTAWHYASGNNRMDKRGLYFNDGDMMFVASFIGVAGGLLVGTGTGVFLEEAGFVQNALPHCLAVWGSASAGTPLVTKQIANAYRVSEHDKHVYLLEQKRKEDAAQLPPPERHGSGHCKQLGHDRSAKLDPIKMT